MRPAGLPRLAPFYLLALVGPLLATGCASLPTAGSVPKTITAALAPSVDSRLGLAFKRLCDGHDSNSGVHMLSEGIDGLTARVEMIDASERSIDVQSYIFRADESGNLIVQALLRAADRGVRIRLLLDDGDSVRGDEQILALSAQTGIEVRIFNPLRYRGHNRVGRAAEFLFSKARLDYRMHNKLMVADNAVGLIGGRNIGNQYFQIDPNSQFGDADVVIAGPVVERLSGVFDEFWNDPIAIPAQAVDKRHTSLQAFSEYKAELQEYRQRLDAERRGNAQPMPRQPLRDIELGRAPLYWGSVQLVYDSPEKKAADKGDAPGKLIYSAVEKQANAVTDELLMVTPYFVPSRDELAVLRSARARHVRVRILTNSLMAAPNLKAQSGYMHYRVQLLQEGVELYEVRALLGSSRGSGQSKALSSYGNYALHAKLFVFDRANVFVGSMNFDERSRHLNTEIGLLIGSREISREIAARFDALTQLDNSYSVALSDAAQARTGLVWTTREAGQVVHLTTEPARNVRQKIKITLLRMLRLDHEL